MLYHFIWITLVALVLWTSDGFYPHMPAAFYNNGYNNHERLQNCKKTEMSRRYGTRKGRDGFEGTKFKIKPTNATFVLQRLKEESQSISNPSSLSSHELYQLHNMFFYGIKPSDPLFALQDFFLHLMAKPFPEITSMDLQHLYELICLSIQPEYTEKYYFGKFKERQINNRLNAILFIFQKISNVVSNSSVSVSRDGEILTLLAEWKGLFSRDEQFRQSYRTFLFDALSSNDWSLHTFRILSEKLTEEMDLDILTNFSVQYILENEIVFKSSSLKLYDPATASFPSENTKSFLKRIKIFGKILAFLGTSPTKFSNIPSTLAQSIDQFILEILQNKDRILVDHQFIYDLFYIQNDRFESLSQPLQQLMMSCCPGGEIFEAIYERKRAEQYHHKFYYLVMMYLRLPSFDIRKISTNQLLRFMKLFEEELSHCGNIEEELNYFQTLYLIQFYHLYSPLLIGVSSFSSTSEIYREIDDRLIRLFFERYSFLQSSTSVSYKQNRNQHKFESLNSRQFTSLLRIMYYIFEKCKHSSRYASLLANLEKRNRFDAKTSQRFLTDSERFDRDQAYEEDRQRIFDQSDKLSDIMNDNFDYSKNEAEVEYIVESAEKKGVLSVSSDISFDRTVFLDQFYDQLINSRLKGMQVYWVLNILKNLKVRWKDLPMRFHRSFTEAIYLSFIPIILENPKFFYQMLYLLKHELQHPDVYCPSILFSRCLQLIQLLLNSNVSMTWKDVNSIFYFMFPSIHTFPESKEKQILKFDERRKGEYDDLPVLRDSNDLQNYEFELSRKKGLASFSTVNVADSFHNKDRRKQFVGLALPVMQQSIVEQLIHPIIKISQNFVNYEKMDPAALIKYYSSMVLSTGRIFSYLSTSNFPRIQTHLLPALKESILALLTTFIEGIKGILLQYRKVLIESDFQLSVIFPPPLYRIFTSVFIVLSKFRIPFQTLPTLQQGLLLFLCYNHEDKITLASLLQSFLYCLATSNEELDRRELSKTQNYVWQIQQRKKITWNLLPDALQQNSILLIEDLLGNNALYKVAFRPMNSTNHPYGIPLIQLLISLTSLNFTSSSVPFQTVITNPLPLNTTLQSSRLLEGNKIGPQRSTTQTLLSRMKSYVRETEKEFIQSSLDTYESKYFLKLLLKYKTQLG